MHFADPGLKLFSRSNAERQASKSASGSTWLSGLGSLGLRSLGFGVKGLGSLGFRDKV